MATSIVTKVLVDSCDGVYRVLEKDLNKSGLFQEMNIVETGYGIVGLRRAVAHARIRVTTMKRLGYRVIHSDAMECTMEADFDSTMNAAAL